MMVKPGVLGKNKNRNKFRGDLPKGPVFPPDAPFRWGDLYQHTLPVVETDAVGPAEKGLQVPVGGKPEQGVKHQEEAPQEEGKPETAKKAPAAPDFLHRFFIQW
jgi:hypothetical protein